MMKRGIIASLCCAFALCLALVGCGGQSGSDAAANDAEAAKAAFAGTWDLSGMTQNGEETSQSDIETLAALGLEVYLNLNEDGTAELMLFGESMDGTWETSSATAAKVTLDDEAIGVTLEGENLKMEQSGSSLVFKKGQPHTSATTAASSDAAASGEAESADGEAADDEAADDEAADEAAAEEETAEEE